MRCARSSGWLLAVAMAVVLAAGTSSIAVEPDSFTIVMLPDTQNYSEKFPETYLAQTQWIKDRADEDNTAMVIHVGDIVQTATVEKEWEAADRAHRVLDGVVPYSVLPGNHDGAPGKTELYNKYFSPERFADAPWYGGGMDDKNDNNFCLFDAATMKFMVLSLEFDPRPETLAWANEIVADHPDRRVIVVTHSYITPKGRNAIGDSVFKQLITKHENIFMVIGGHVLGVNHQTSTNDDGGTVHEILCDYQGFPNGGDGWLQTMRFAPEEDKIHVAAYSPLLDESNDAPQHTYVLDYDMEVKHPPVPSVSRPRVRQILRLRPLRGGRR